MRKLLLTIILLVCTTMNTVLAAHWVPLQEGTDRVPGVLYDEASMQKSEDNLYFWEKVQRFDGSYELRLAKIGLKNLDFSDALIAVKFPAQEMLYLHPQKWDEHGASAHPIRAAWMDKVLAQLNHAQRTDKQIDLDNAILPQQ